MGGGGTRGNPCNNASLFIRANRSGFSTPARHCPHVAIIHKYDDVEKACSLLRQSTGNILSFDTETTVTRKKLIGIPSVIQLATFKHCFIFQIYRMMNRAGPCKAGFPEPLRELLSSNTIIKVGVGAIQDSKELESKFASLKISNVFDLQSLLEALKLPASISKFSRVFSLPVYREKPIDSKLSWKAHLKRNWDYELNLEEINYASKDVFAVLSGLRSLVRNAQPDLLKTEVFDFDAILEPIAD